MIKKNFKKILVPIDGSKNSLRGLDHAIYLARQCQATITGIYIMPIYPRSFSDSIMPYQIVLKKEATKFMNNAKTLSAKKGIIFNSKIDYGSPSVDIPNFAKDKKFDLIVIGSRGVGTVKGFFLGSTSNYVLHKSSIPVLIVK